VYKVYCKHIAEKKEQLRSGIEVVLDENATKVVGKKKKDALVEPAAAVQLTNPIESMEFGYSSLKPHLEKSKAVLDPSAKPICSICKSGVEAEKSFAVVCPHTDCSATSHVHCLSADFLRQENNSDSILPVSGNCPSCHTHTQWSSLVRELSLRKRGGKEIEKLFKIPRRKKGDAVDAAVSAMEAKERDDDEEGEVEGDESEEERRFEEFEAEASMIDLSESPKRVRRRSKSPSLEIKDSDWDDIDELD
jgi:structure-specific endonuclease subunit SLX1